MTQQLLGENIRPIPALSLKPAIMQGWAWNDKPKTRVVLEKMIHFPWAHVAWYISLLIPLIISLLPLSSEVGSIIGRVPTNYFIVFCTVVLFPSLLRDLFGIYSLLNIVEFKIVLLLILCIYIVIWCGFDNTSRCGTEAQFKMTPPSFLITFSYVQQSQENAYQRG